MNNQPNHKKEETKPLVSVILSTYNRADKFLGRAIESVLAQNVKDFELLVIDDCSTDKTKDLILSYSKKDPRVKYYRTAVNSGSDTLPKNLGISISKGDYIAYLDDDCEFLSYHLEVLLNEFKNSPDIDIAYCDSRIFWQDHPEKKPTIAINRDFDAQFLINRNFIDTSQVMHKREIVFNVGGWDQTLPKFVDWNLWVRMAKWGAKFQHVPIIATNYYVHENTKSNRIQTRTWTDPETGLLMFDPTYFNPAGCYIYLPYLGNDKLAEIQPQVVIFTITYDRLEYTKRMYDTLKASTKYPFEWCVFDNGSKDGTINWLKEKTPNYSGSGSNRGLSFASNYLLDKILKEKNWNVQIIIKVDNDCEFKTKQWLEEFIDLWKRNHKLYMSPYPEGLIDNPGGGPRVGTSFIGPYFVEVTTHIGGLCAFIDARAYKKFRWTDKFLHGNQDREASEEFRRQGYMPCYVPDHRIMHMDSTLGQKQKYPEYFERRKTEKTTQVATA